VGTTPKLVFIECEFKAGTLLTYAAVGGHSFLGRQRVALPSQRRIRHARGDTLQDQQDFMHDQNSTDAVPIITVQQHILLEQQRFPGASGEFSWLLSGITMATKMIQARVRCAGLTDVLGAHGSVNVQGEVQQKLDVYANEVLAHCLSVRERIGVLASEENEQPLLVHKGSENASYAVVFDPLDGSSNIDVNVSVGTTFSILRRPPNASLDDPERWVLQPGTAQVAAGYVVYGSSTILVYTVGNGVHGFTLDPAVGAFILSHPNIRMPEQGKYYSVNEAYRDTFPPQYGKYIERLRHGELGRRYASRYIGSMVADFHRTLLKGGVFLYPPTDEHPQGKLRLLYEANPVAMLAEQAGGVAIDGTQRILDIQPESIHQRTPLVVGSPVEVHDFEHVCAAG
jgi:fructose-1,6-bisphosphatase I